MSLITFQNLPNTSTPLNAENLNNNFNELSKKGEFFIARMSNDYTFQSTDIEDLNINTKVLSNGNSLSLSNGGIKIGAGINHVLVFGNVYWYTGIPNKLGITYIYQNSSSRIVNNTTFSDNYQHTPTGTIVMSVSQNDIIYLKAKISDTSSSPLIKNYASGTYLGVVVLD